MSIEDYNLEKLGSGPFHKLLKELKKEVKIASL